MQCFLSLSHKSHRGIRKNTLHGHYYYLHYKKIKYLLLGKVLTKKYVMRIGGDYDEYM